MFSQTHSSDRIRRQIFRRKAPPRGSTWPVPTWEPVPTPRCPCNCKQLPWSSPPRGLTTSTWRTHKEHPERGCSTPSLVFTKQTQRSQLEDTFLFVCIWEPCSLCSCLPARRAETKVHPIDMPPSPVRASRFATCNHWSFFDFRRSPRVAKLRPLGREVSSLNPLVLSVADFLSDFFGCEVALSGCCRLSPEVARTTPHKCRDESATATSAKGFIPRILRELQTSEKVKAMSEKKIYQRKTVTGCHRGVGEVSKHSPTSPSPSSPSRSSSTGLMKFHKYCLAVAAAFEFTKRLSSASPLRTASFRVSDPRPCSGENFDT